MKSVTDSYTGIIRKEPAGDFQAFLRGETRYAALERTFPNVAEILFNRTEAEAKAHYAKYKALSNA